MGGIGWVELADGGPEGWPFRVVVRTRPAGARLPRLANMPAGA